MGMAMAKRDGTCVVVACYHPRGNIVGQFIDNVPKPVKNSWPLAKQQQSSGTTANGNADAVAAAISAITLLAEVDSSLDEKSAQPTVDNDDSQVESELCTK